MGQRLKNAPVFYTVAQIRHNPILRISDTKTIIEIQDKFRQLGYPDYQAIPTIDINLFRPEAGIDSQQMQPTISPFERHTFTNLDASKGFVVDKNAVSFQTTDYDVFESFLNDFMAGVRILHECIGYDFIRRIGIRYLDMVTHPEGAPGIFTYLQSGVHGIQQNISSEDDTEGGLRSIHFTRSESKFESRLGTVLARVLISGGPLAIPPDLQLGGITVKDKFKSYIGTHAVIDTDASHDKRMHFDIDKLAETLDQLHKYAGTAFRSTVTQEALKAWA